MKLIISLIVILFFLDSIRLEVRIIRYYYLRRLFVEFFKIALAI